MTSENNELWHNIFYHNKQAPFRESKSNKAHFNLFVGDSFQDFAKEAWGDENFQTDLELKFTPESIHLSTPEVLPAFEAKYQLSDFLDQSVDPKRVICGPFQTFAGKELMIKFPE